MAKKGYKNRKKAQFDAAASQEEAIKVARDAYLHREGDPPVIEKSKFKCPSSALNWVYGCRAPQENMEYIRDQFWRGNKLYNMYIAIEQRRRRQLIASWAANFPPLWEAFLAWQAADKAVADGRSELNREFQQARRRTTNVPQQQTIAALREDCAAKRELYITVLRATAKTKEYKDIEAALELDAKAYRKWARDALPMYWGTSNFYVEAASQAIAAVPLHDQLRFRRYIGTGTVGCQVQNGMNPQHLFDAGATLVRIHQLSPARGDGCRQGEIWIRVGSTGRHNREPLWAKVRFSMHREIPENCSIRYAWLRCRRTGTQEHWDVRLVLKFDAPYEKRGLAQTGVVGIDLGWRKIGDDLRVAYWYGSDGREGQLLMPAEELELATYLQSRQSQEDTLLQNMLQELDAWRQANAQIVPQWLTTMTERLTTWKSFRRLQRVVWYWRQNRFDGDAAIMKRLGGWSRDQIRIHNERTHAQQKFERRREHLYRNFAASMYRAYRSVHVEQMDLAKLKQNPNVEDDPESPRLKLYFNTASPGELRQYLTESAAKSVLIPARLTTMTCFACGDLSQEINRANLHHTCTRCGAVFDQDRNAAIWLLRGGVPPETGGNAGSSGTPVPAPDTPPATGDAA